MADSLINLKDMTIEDLEQFCMDIGEKKFRARQIFKWIYKNIGSIDEMSDLSLGLREKLKEKSCIGNLSIEKKFESNIDGTTKYLLKLDDGNIIESVLMEYSFGISACISTQVGCAMGCSFCASTIGGLVRSLTPGEMVIDYNHAERPRKKDIQYCINGERGTFK
jgi:23S rRNA (adenine2503-C2)-methyltransferase